MAEDRESQKRHSPSNAGSKRFPNPAANGSNSQPRPTWQHPPVAPYRPTTVKVFVPQPQPNPADRSISPETQVQPELLPVSPNRRSPQSYPLPSTPPIASPTLESLEDDDALLADIAPRRRWRPRLRIPLYWQFWSFLAVLACSGAGLFSVALLLKLPTVPNCPSIFWPTASASLRLYCAQLAANKQTVDDLLEAIALVDSLPADHPLRPEINQNIEYWSVELLDLAEKAFHKGELQAAIATARQIPVVTPTYNQVEERITRWQTIWGKAEKIYNDSEFALKSQNLQEAFALATQLLQVGNTYWETTKYQELNTLITAAREDGSKVGRAENLARRGGLANLQAALKLVQEIKTSSPLYATAQALQKELGQDLLTLAEAVLDDGDSQEAIAIARAIPKQTGLEAEAQDFINLALAQAQAENGTVSDLEAAIIQAQRLGRDRPFYDKAQQLIQQWQAAIRDLNRMESARQLAAAGDPSSLAAAVAEAQEVSRSNREAQREIQQWATQAQTLEDRPYLDRAEQFARSGDIASLQSAIAEANRIGEGRALYGDAQRQIRTWTGQIQRMQDQPYLAQARQLAEAGDLAGAIATVQQIQPGRTLYNEAQGEVRNWQSQTEGQAQLRDAYRAAELGTVSSLVSAIQLADRVSADSTARSEADQMINAWSQIMLQLAETQAQSDVAAAIAIAAAIPSRTEAYAAAQLQIQAWQQQTEPLPSP